MLAQQHAGPEVKAQPSETAIATPAETMAPANDSPTAPRNIHEIQRGWKVVDSNGQLIGDVFGISHALRGGDGYIIVQQHHLFSKRARYIPASAISKIEHERVVLNVTRSEADASRWNEPPRS